MSGLHTRNPLVCGQSKCFRCDLSRRSVPESCQFEILHLLGDVILGDRDMPRRSGKTMNMT